MEFLWRVWYVGAVFVRHWQISFVRPPLFLLPCSTKELLPWVSGEGREGQVGQVRDFGRELTGRGVTAHVLAVKRVYPHVFRSASIFFAVVCCALGFCQLV